MLRENEPPHARPDRRPSSQPTTPAAITSPTTTTPAPAALPGVSGYIPSNENDVDDSGEYAYQPVYPKEAGARRNTPVPTTTRTIAAPSKTFQTTPRAPMTSSVSVDPDT